MAPRICLPGVVYPTPEVASTYVEAGIFTDATLVSAFREVCHRFANRVAISDDAGIVSYAELDRSVGRFAAALRELGLAPLDRVLFQVENSRELLIAFLACLRSQLVPICTLTAHRAAEIGQIGRQAGAKAHLVSVRHDQFDLVDFAVGMRRQIPTLEHVIVVGDDELELPAEGVVDFRTVVDASAAVGLLEDLEEIDPWQVAVFQLSGGTTSTPKIIPRFHNEYLYSARQVIEFHGFDENVVVFTPNPMMHNAPMLCFWLPALLTGGEVAVATSSAGIDGIAWVLRSRRPTWAFVAPVHLQRLIERGDLDRDLFAGSHGYAVAAQAEAIRRITGVPALPMYGMSEGFLAFTHPNDPAEAIRDCVGRAVSPYDELRVLVPGTEREVVPAGTTGELAVRGPSVIAGYLDAPERDAEAFTSDGFYRTGDLVRLRFIDGRWFLRFEGRLKDVVDRGGEKINCAEVETALAAHPDIAAVSCIGLPDAQYGERMCAVIVPRTPTIVPSVRDLATHLEALGLAKFKYPERVVAIEEIPMTASGKPSKQLLRERIAQA